MDAERWQQLKRIFTEALEIDAADRARFLDQACAGDADLRRAAEELLASYHPEYLEDPAVGEVAEFIAETPPIRKSGERIDDYEILRTLGSGGQATVYLAQDHELNRRVAIKLLPKETLEGASGEERFRREAMTAAALSHPNICPIHKVGADRDQPFIVMRFVDGKTVAELLADGPIPAREAVDLAIQACDALDAAHRTGIVHRDIKPSNLIVDDSSHLTVLDFGLAKRIRRFADGEASITRSGTVMGTVSYMSPEQSKGREVDARTDIWSVGVCLYEMLTGKNPFASPSIAETFAAILSVDPDLSDLPKGLQPIVARALKRRRGQRFATIAELATALRRFRDESEFIEQLRSGGLQIPTGANRRDKRFRFAAAVLAVVTLVAVGIGISRYLVRQNFERTLERIAALAAEDRSFEAFDLAVGLRRINDRDPRLASLLPLISDSLSVVSDPPGARVYLKRFTPRRDGRPDRQLIGETPINGLEIARGRYVIEIEKDGFATFTGSISGRLPDYKTDLISLPPIAVRARLIGSEKVPDRMAYVPGGEYRLWGYSRPSAEVSVLGDFLIDKYEVTNQEFRDFVIAGGYLKPEFWTDAGVNGADPRFRDRTGLPGPRGWVNQTFPGGEESMPVTGISWYEAAAYARFRGKQLPTIHQWEKAARDGRFDEAWNTMPWGLHRDSDLTDEFANFGANGVVPVDLYEFGQSPYGCWNMAGNVSEWLRDTRLKRPLTGGGSWGEKPYLFGYYADFPPEYDSNRIGLRLVRQLGNDPTGGRDFPVPEPPVFKTTSRTEFKAWSSHYNYDREPLDPVVAETVEHPDWIRQKIEYNGADHQRTFAYLYLPRGAKRPLQAVHWIPAADVPLKFSSLAHSVEDFLTPVIKSGRAVFAVALNEYPERDRNAERESGEIARRRRIVRDMTDLRRGLDYLVTRDDIDSGAIGFAGLSLGGNLGVILTSIDDRYRSAAFVGIGARSDETDWTSEIRIHNFAPHSPMPKMILKGRYDEVHPIASETMPMFRIMREPKRLTIVESGHVPPPEIFGPTIIAWLDESLGPVTR